MDNNENDKIKCKKLRKQVFLTAYGRGVTHLASCYSCIEILYVLYEKGVMKFDKTNPHMADRDKLVLSKGHAGLALYCVMSDIGILDRKELKSFLQPFTRIGGEPSIRDLESIEASTGSLGHGLSMGIGMAMAQKMDKRDAKTYVIIGDGECGEGTIWEGAMSAAAYHLDNLITILDCNELQKMGKVEKTIGLTNWKEKWEAFGWEVSEVDGHNVNALYHSITSPNLKNKPKLIIAHTIKGKGVSVMENNPIWHFKMPNKKELAIFKEELDIKEDELE